MGVLLAAYLIEVVGVPLYYQRLTGDHQALRDQGLVASCRRAVDGLDATVHATLIEGRWG